MIKTISEAVIWTECSDECQTEIYRIKKLKLQEAIAYCIHDRVRGLRKHVQWSLLYQYAGMIQNGQFASIDDVIESFKNAA